MELVSKDINPVAFVEEARDVVAKLDESMDSSSFRAARADINAQIKEAEKIRTTYKKQFIDEFNEQFKDIYKMDELNALHKMVDKMFRDADKQERDADLKRIEALIVETNDGQVDRKQLPSAGVFRKKSDSYVISHIEEQIDAIIYSEQEEELAPPATEEVVENDFSVTMTMTIEDKQLARTIRGLCRENGVKVSIQKG